MDEWYKDQTIMHKVVLPSMQAPLFKAKREKNISEILSGAQGG